MDRKNQGEKNEGVTGGAFLIMSFSWGCPKSQMKMTLDSPFLVFFKNRYKKIILFCRM